MIYGPYDIDLTVHMKVLPKHATAVLPISSATEVQAGTSSKAWKPLPPGNVKLDGNDYASWPATTSGDVTLGWSHRNRISQGIGAAIVAQDAAGSYTPEGTIKVEVLIAGVVKRTWAGLTGTSQVYTLTQRTADDADLGHAVQFRLTPINGIYQGTVRTTPAFLMG